VSITAPTPNPNTTPHSEPAIIAAATVWRRFMGMVYEALLLFGPMLVIAFVYSVIVGFNDRSGPEFHELKRTGLQIVLTLALLLYFRWGWSLGRCTLPMQTLGLRLKMRDGRDVPPRTAAIRFVVALPSVLLGLGFLWAIVDRDGQTLHDRVAGTRLVYIPVGKVI
jgi:uncharacterized RDD family membrane protein YckC